MLGLPGVARSASPTAMLSNTPCELGTLEGTACVLGRVVASRPINGSGPLGIAAGAKAAADADAEFFKLADIEAKMVNISAELLPERRQWGPATFPAERHFAAATRWALLGQTESAIEALKDAQRAQSQYRQQFNPANAARIDQFDALAYQVHAAVVAYHRGERGAAAERFAAAARAMPTNVSMHETAGPLTRADALRYWLDATWDIAPVFEVASALEDSEREPLLADALAIATLVPRQREAATRLVDMARLVAQRQGRGLLAMWSVRASANCFDQMAHLVQLDGASPVWISLSLQRAAVSQRLLDVEALRTAVAGLFVAWRQHYCQRTLPHHHLALTAAWIDTYRTLSRIKAASPKPDDLSVISSLGHAATFLAEVAADLRSPARVREALALSDAIMVGLRTAAYLGFMGSGREVGEWALGTRINILHDMRGHTVAAAALGAAFGHTYARRLPAPAVSEGVPGGAQPCALPVFSSAGLYSTANLSKVQRASAPASCVARASQLSEKALVLDRALAAERSAQCQFLQAQTAANLASWLMRSKVDALEQAVIELVKNEVEPSPGPSPPGSLGPHTEALLRAWNRYNQLERASNMLQLWVALLDSSVYSATYAVNEVLYAQQLREVASARDARRSAWRDLSQSQSVLVAECVR